MRRPGRVSRLAAGVAIIARIRAQRRVPWLSASELSRRQERAVRAAVDHACRHVPYYRETIRRLGIEPHDLRTAADLARLPVIGREQVQADPEYFVSDATPPEEIVTVGSGGSTGRPVMISRDRASVLLNPLYSARAGTVIAGIAESSRLSVVSITPPDSSGGTLRKTLERSAAFARGVRSTTRHLSLLEHPSTHTEAIDRHRPHLVASYGSYIEQLLLIWESGEGPRHLPAVVAYGADALSDEGRERARRLGITPLSVYQSVEAGPIGFECERGGAHHVNVDACAVRITDEDGRDVPRGESGDVVISNLLSRATVLLNYRQGDVAHALGPCRCGRTLPRISLIEGRSAEWLTGPRGEPVHPQAVKMLLRLESPIRRYQVTQQRRDRFLVLVVVARGTDRSALTARLTSRFAEQFGAGTDTEVRFVDDIPRTPAGKVRAVIAAAAP